MQITYYAATTMAYGDSAGGWSNYHPYLNVVPTVPARTHIRCEHCGIKNKVDAPFCQACGAPLPD